MTYFIYRLAAWLLFYVNDLIGYPLFGLAGFMLYLFSRRTRATVAANMRIVLGPQIDESQVQQVTREAFRNLLWNYYDLFHLPAFTSEAIRRRLQIEGVEHLEQALARGKGAIMVGLHFGNTEVLMQVPLLYPHMKFVMLVEKMADARIFDLMRRLRESRGMEMIPIDEPFKIMRRLKQNCIVGIAADRDVTHSGMIFDFFGKPAQLPDGPVRLALRMGTPIIPAFGWRETNGRFQVKVLPPLAMQHTGSFDHDVRVNMGRLLKVFEEIIRARPGQWMAFHRLWLESPTPLFHSLPRLEEKV